MDSAQAASLARTLMNEHGFGSVPFQFNKRRKAFGVTKFKRSKAAYVPTGDWYVAAIELSEPLVLINSEAQVRDVILHEIAHAKAGVAAGHGWQWKAIAHSIGCNAERLCGEGTVHVTGRYQAHCGCMTHNFYRKPKRAMRCARCLSSLVILDTRESVGE